MKYHNHKVTFGGITYDSKLERDRHLILMDMERRGEIRNLKRQVKYILIPAQYMVNGKVKKCLERECSYIADFVYDTPILKGEPYMTEPLERVVEDTKGFRTKDYIIKRKLMLYVHGIKIKEIGKEKTLR